MTVQARHRDDYDPSSSADNSRASGLAWATLLFGVGCWIVFPIIGAVVAIFCGLLERRRIAEGTVSKRGAGPVKIGIVAAAIQLVVAMFAGGVAVLFVVVEFIAAIGG